MTAPAGYLYAIVLSLWVGGMSLFTFMVTPVIFRSYPRDTAGEIVGKLFPSYFPFTLAVSAAAWVLFFVASPGRGGAGYGISLSLVSLAVITALYVNFVLYPRARKAKQEVRSFGAGAEADPSRARFRRLHAQSAVLNLFMIADGLALLLMNSGMKK